jgi:hypothetical protein
MLRRRYAFLRVPFHLLAIQFVSGNQAVHVAPRIMLYHVIHLALLVLLRLVSFRLAGLPCRLHRRTRRIGFYYRHGGATAHS